MQRAMQKVTMKAIGITIKIVMFCDSLVQIFVVVVVSSVIVFGVSFMAIIDDFSVAIVVVVLSMVVFVVIGL